MEDQLFYVGQKAFIKKGDAVLILHDPRKRIDFPGGKIQEGEIDLQESLKREVREETGLEVSVGNAFTTWVHTMPKEHKLAGKKVYLVGFICEYLSGDILLSHEHSTFRWVNRENYQELADGSPYFAVLEAYFKR